MRYLGIIALLSLELAAASEPSPLPAGKVVKDGKGSCQILVPQDWTLADENTGSAVFHDASNAIAVVTSQPGQTFQPLSASLQKVLGVAKDKMFENSPKRIFYQDKVARDLTDSSAFSVMVPGKNGTCSAHLVFLSSVKEETAKKIALSLAPAAQ